MCKGPLIILKELSTNLINSSPKDRCYLYCTRNIPPRQETLPIIFKFLVAQTVNVGLEDRAVNTAAEMIFRNTSEV